MLDDTVVVFTADHGEYLGEHGLYGKNHLYETAYRVPMLVRWPAAAPGGTVVERLAGTVDFQPSILGLMGVAPSGREQGRDLSAVWRGEPDNGPDEAYQHHSSQARAGVFTPAYHLAHVKGGESILFDRRRDPEQAHNLYDDPAHRDAARELTARIAAHHVEIESPEAAWLQELHTQ